MHPNPHQYPNINTNFLTIGRVNWMSSHSPLTYTNRPRALQCLQEALKLSETMEGCERLYDISSSWMDYLFEGIKTKGIGGDADQLHFRLVIGLLKCERFWGSALRYENVMENYRDYNYGNNFRRFSNVLADMLQDIKKQQIQQQLKTLKGTPKYTSTFPSKHHAQQYLPKQQDWCNFTHNSALFHAFYKQYIDMLIGAARVGAVESVVDMFPKGCFGCALYNVVKWSDYVGEREQGMELMGLLFGVRDVWEVDKFYREIVQMIKDTNRKYDLYNRDRISCMDLKQYRQIFSQLNNLNRQNLLYYFVNNGKSLYRLNQREACSKLKKRFQLDESERLKEELQNQVKAIKILGKVELVDRDQKVGQGKKQQVAQQQQNEEDN